MTIFRNEAELLALLDKMDALIDACVRGLLEFHLFHNEIGYLYSNYALDGHESDEEELSILERHHPRISWIEHVLQEIREVCSDEDASKKAYILVGRFGSAEALRRLRVLVQSRVDGQEPGV